MIRSVAVSLLLAVSACASNPSVIGAISYDPSYTPGDPFAITPEVTTIIRGTPYTGGSAVGDRDSILAAMQDQGFGQTRFTQAQMLSPYRVVMLFGPAVQMKQERVCSVPPGGFPEPGAVPAGAGEVPVTAVLCIRDELLSAGVGHLPAGPVGNPATNGAIGGFVRVLFPYENPVQGGDQP